jgi:glyoxylase-like metal-dependent hydrolase (beta-lactamase superfamily II)
MTTAAEPGVAIAVHPLVRRLLAPNPNMFTGPGTNTWLVGAQGAVTVVDPGPDVPEHLDAIQAAAPEIGLIVVTHTHSDHSPGAASLAARTGAPVLGFGPMLRPGVEHHDDTFRADRLLVDGDVVEGPDHRLVAVHTPGHASNHLCYILDGEGERLILTGDHVMQGSTVVIAPLDGDMTEYIEQLHRLQALAADRLLPGHGDPIDDPHAYIQQYLDHRAAREAQIAVALDAAGPEGATAEALVAAVYTDVPAHLHPVALYSTWAILRKLADGGRATTKSPDERDATWFPAREEPS